MTGAYSSSPTSLPLPLEATILPTLAFSGVLIGAISHRWGPLWWVGSILGFSIIGLVRMALKS